MATALVPCLTAHGQHALIRRCGFQRSSRLVVQAATTHRGPRHHHTYERVLRYPSGETRYIRYPIEATLDEDDDAETFAAWDVSGLWGINASRSGESGQQAVAALPKQQQARTTGSSLSETAAFLEGLFAASYEVQPLMDVDKCYQILRGCPWLLSRPVFVLACKGKTASLEDDIRSTYTLRVKVKQEGAAEGLAKLLNKPHLAEALDIAEMRDGVVAFETDEDADKFAGMLEEEGHSQVMVAEVDSHRLFRMVADVKALVVFLPSGQGVPPPYQLAASLKQKTSWDSL